MTTQPEGVFYPYCASSLNSFSLLRQNTVHTIGAALLLLTMALSDTLMAASNDLLLLLEPDGKHYLAQRTLTTEKELLLLDLPAGRQVLLQQFSGPERLTFSTAHDKTPDTLSLWSGAVITRYRHQYTDGLDVQNDGSLKITMSEAHSRVSSDDANALRSSVTWVLPEGATLLSYTAHNEDPNVIGSWFSSENIVNYTQNHGTLSGLTLHFSLENKQATAIVDPCVAVLEPTDECSPDSDQDAIPDYRDICLSTQGSLKTSKNRPVDTFGCDGQQEIILANVNFNVGNSYLDATARETLDRVALALQRVPAQLVEVSAHTDNVGTSKNNLRLSQKRAAAVRHYLMLRGAGPNQINSIGYGEQFPVNSNETPSGRRGNRRVELKRIN